MIRLKDSVNLNTIKPELIIGIMVLYSVMHEFNIEMVITSAADSKHSENSLHYQGYAVDIRSKHIPSRSRKFEILAIAKNLMDKQFDIILESEGEDNEHYHLEYDPK